MTVAKMHRNRLKVVILLGCFAVCISLLHQIPTKAGEESSKPTEASSNSKRKSLEYKIARESESYRRNRPVGLPDLSARHTWLSDKGVPVKLDRGMLLQYVEGLDPESLDLDGDQGGYLQSLFFWCELNELDQVLAFFSKTQGDSSNKNLYLTSILNRVMNEGGADSFSNVLDAIKKNLGNGQSAALALNMAFASAGFSESVIKELRKVSNPDERRKILIAMSTSLRWSRDLESLKGINLTTLEGDEKDSLLKALAQRVSNSKGIGLDFETALDEAFFLVESGKDASQILSECGRIAPFETWKIISDYAGKLDAEGIDAARKSTVLAMARENGPLAMSRVLAMQANPARAILIQQGLIGFLNSNPKEAQDWVNQNSKSMQPREIDSVKVAFIETSLGKHDVSSARAYLDSIIDPETKIKAEGKVWTAERDSLRREVGKDPAGTMQSIIKGQSNYQDYWLEEAMTTWVARDFDTAQGWYQQNWQTLPADKAQYVAAAFATHAIKQGDAATARQWAAHIQNPKTKQRILAGIAKAEGQ